MQRFALLSVIVVIVTPAAFADEVQTNPMAKVIELIDGLSAKITREGEAEEAAYKEFFAWCDDTSRNGNFAIKTATAKKEKLEATIEKATGDAEASAVKIEDLAGKIAQDEADLQSATDVRAKENADFAANEAELVETVDTLGRAIGIIDKEMAKSGAALAQVDTSNIDKVLRTMSTLMDAAAFSNADKKKLVALVQSKQADADDDAEFGAPAAATYKSQSGGILDLLEDMKEKADQELADLRKAENNAQHNFNMLKQGLEDSIKADTDDLNQEKDSKAASEELKATSEKEHTATVKSLKEANESLDMAHANCMQTSANHEASVNARNEELSVIAKAKQILLDSTSGAVDHSYSLLQVASHLRSRSDLTNAEVAAKVKNLAQQYHSSALAQLASKVTAIAKFGASAGDDPFAKIKGLIADMIAKLEAEALAEANEKAYCDEQMSKTKTKKEELEHDRSKLTSKIDTAAAKSAGLKEDVKELQAELAALAKLQAEMDQVRQDTHAAYVKASTDLKQGLTGVRKALGVLRDYYGSAAAALVQAPMPTMTFHSKAGGAGTSIIGILEVCESDFAKGLAAEETEEADAQSEYEAMTQKNKVTRVTKEQDVKYKSQSFKGLDKEIAELSSDRAATQTELDAVLEYYGKIKDRCIAKPETYEERKKRREAEIAGLKDALATLENETAFVQRGKRGLRKHFLGVH